VVISTEQSVKAARDVARQAARERQRQAEERVSAAEQALNATKETSRIALLNLERVKSLEQKGLRSRRDLEVVQNEEVRAATEVKRAENSLEIAKRDTNVTSLEQTRADLEVVRAQAELARAIAALDAAQRDTRVGDLDVNKVEADTRGSISASLASLASVRETLASIDNDIIKLEIDLQNQRRRTRQRTVIAPANGRVVRLLRAGSGETVKTGDVLAVLAPSAQTYKVALYISENDAPFLYRNAPVRVQFAGFPALQFVNLPLLGVGTFAGRVQLIDAVDDGKGRYRVVVAEDSEAVTSGKERPWPSLNSVTPENSLSIRPGATVNGWIMLREVSLGFELWRQFNAFPLLLPSSSGAQGKEKTDGYTESDPGQGESKEKSKRKAKLK
jgi:multidrug resistance efflux pump